MSEVGLLKEGKAREGQKKGNLYIEVTNDITLKKGDKIFLNDYKQSVEYTLENAKSEKQREWAEKELEKIADGTKSFIKKKLVLAKNN